jgi:hypothetical protein
LGDILGFVLEFRGNGDWSGAGLARWEVGEKGVLGRDVVGNCFFELLSGEIFLEIVLKSFSEFFNENNYFPGIFR